MNQLQAMTNLLSRSMNTMRVGTANNVRRVLLQVRNSTGRQFRDHYKAPAKLDFIVGLDEPFNKTKIDLLREGSSVLILTGLAGSGKTTLARELCSDEQVISEFGKNISFIIISSRPNLEIIVQTLYEHCGYQVPEFQSDEESLVEIFCFQMPGYKILVTSIVAFQRFGPPIHLEPLCYDAAMTLSRHFAHLNGKRSYINDNLVPQVVRGCGGSPLAPEVIGKSFREQPIVVWQNMVRKLSKGHATLDSNTELLAFLHKCLEVSEDKPRIMECFRDLRLFSEDQMITADALINMWEELYKLEDDGIEAMYIINELATKNLANLLVTRCSNIRCWQFCCLSCYQNQLQAREDSLSRSLELMEVETQNTGMEILSERDNSTGRQFMGLCTPAKPDFIVGFDEPFSKSKIDLLREGSSVLVSDWYGRIWKNHTMARKLCWDKQVIDKFREGVISCLVKSLLAKWCFKLKQPEVIAHTLSMSTDEMFTLDLFNMQTAEAEVLIFNLRTTQYFLSEFMEKMSKPKVLIVTNYGIYPFELMNLQKLSLYTCNTVKAFNVTSEFQMCCQIFWRWVLIIAMILLNCLLGFVI